VIGELFYSLVSYFLVLIPSVVPVHKLLINTGLDNNPHQKALNIQVQYSGGISTNALR